MKKTKSHEDFVKEIYAINHNIKIIGKYTGALNRIECECNICGYNWIPFANNLKKSGCPECSARKLSRNHNDFTNEVYKKNKNIEIIGTYISRKYKVKVRCLICGNEWDAHADNLLQGHGCPKCAKNMKYTTNTFIDSISKINPHINVLGKYTNAHTPIECECKNCGNIWKPKPHNLINGKGCPHCSSSKGERNIKAFLDSNHIQYIRSAKFEGLKGIGNRPLSYDFYIPNENLLIEYQGKQHFEPISFFGGGEYYDIQVEHDKRKRQYAYDNDIKLLEINYNDDNNLYDILADELKIA